jgi:hypothetical protein
MDIAANLYLPLPERETNLDTTGNHCLHVAVGA